MCVLVAQPCPTLCDPMDYSPPSSSAYGTVQQKYWRILEWVAIFFSIKCIYTLLIINTLSHINQVKNIENVLNFSLCLFSVPSFLPEENNSSEFYV